MAYIRVYKVCFYCTQTKISHQCQPATENLILYRFVVQSTKTVMCILVMCSQTSISHETGGIKFTRTIHVFTT